MGRRSSPSSSSSAMRRLQRFWLPLLLGVLLVGYWSQARYNPEREAKQGMEQLNLWRRQAGLEPLAHSPSLQQAAQKHAQYLSKDAEGHDERNHSNPYFTGADPQARAAAAGYAGPVVENLSVGNLARQGNANVNSLMTALYHRLTLLTPSHDEAGAAWVNGRHHAFVVVQGSSRLRQLCEHPPTNSNAPYIMKIPCKGVMTSVPTQRPLYVWPVVVKFPVGSQIEPDYDGSEVPNPMPGHKKTGNPVSVAIYGLVGDLRLVSFKLFAPDGEVKDTHILTHQNDPNHLLDKNEFALFALKPLAFDTEYRAEFRYQADGGEKKEVWTFRTRKKRHWFE